MEEKPIDLDQITSFTKHWLTLESHDGKAIVKKDKSFKHKGHDVGWYELGDVKGALEVEIC